MRPLYASIDVGGTNLHAAIADAEGAVIAEGKEATLSYQGPTAVMQRMAALVKRLAEECGQRPEALGIGVPGLLDLDSGRTLFFPNMPTQWREVPLRETMEAWVQCPVRLLNDARAATLGELVFGHGRTLQDMIFFTLGTGVGGGVVIDGKLRLGPLGAAGELGHQTMIPDGLSCSCGNRGCLETLASGPALAGEGVRLMLSGNAPVLHEICSGDIGRITPKTMAEAAARGEPLVIAAIERMAGWIGLAAANLITALHPQLVVLGGGVSELGELLLKPVREMIHQRVGMLPTHEIRVDQSLLRDRAGLLGGIALAMQRGINVAS
jgi:glucokinase